MLKNIIITLIILGISSFDLTASVQKSELRNIVPNFEQTDMYKLRENYEEIWKDVPNSQRKGWKQYKRWEYFWTQRLFPKADYRNAIDIYSKEINKFLLDKNDKLQNESWRLIGPITQPEKYNSSDNKGLGRVNVVRFHPTNPDIMWIGSATGGVWKTKDRGKTWENFPFTQFLSLGVSDIAISPTNPDIIYVATGDADGSLGTGSNFYSIGVIKTTDGGNTWNITNLSYELADRNTISRLKVSNTDPNTILAATTSGIFKSTDGGESWEKKFSRNFRDLEIKPNDDNYVYAATFGRFSSSNYVFISKDFGDTWEQSLEIPKAGRIQLAVTPKAPENLYVLSSTAGHDGFHSFMVSADAGATYGLMSDSNTAKNPLSWKGGDLSESRRGQSSYDLALAVAPYDKDAVILGGIENHNSNDMGANWALSSNVTGSPNSVIHVDMHDLEFNPLTEELYCANDGGIYVSQDGGLSWKDISAGLSITQFYRIATSQRNPDVIIGGAQDNGTSLYLNGKWNQIYGGDGMDCAIDPRTDNTIWFSIYNGVVLKSKNAGKLFDLACNPKLTDGVEGAWITPFVLDRVNPDVVYIGFSNIWKSYNGGSTWNKVTDLGKYSGVFTGISIAESDNKIIFAWKQNVLFQSKDAGSNWSVIPLGETNYITSVTANPQDPNKFWYTVSGFNPSRKVFYYNGEEIINVTGNLPNVPINSSVALKNSNNRIYIGTDIGVFYTDSESNQWDNINENLPNLIINDMEIFYGSDNTRLRVGTYGRGVWETDISECNKAPIEISQKENITKCPHEEVTISVLGEYDSYKWSNGETSKAITVTEAGAYSVTAMSNNCKHRSNTVIVHNINTPEVYITVFNNAKACIGDTLTLSASKGFNTYKWSNGETEREIKVHKSGSYQVIAKRDNVECESYSTVLNLEFTPKPESMDFEIHGRFLEAQEMAQYQWYKDGKSIYRATERVYEIPETDNEEALYKVFGSNENGCGVFSAEKAASFTDVKETFTNVYSIYPNPSKGLYNLNLLCQAGDNISYKISDISGKVIFEFDQTMNNNELNSKIDISSYPDGAYLMHISVNGKEKIIKLIKK